jgi:hypothetical protein
MGARHQRGEVDLLVGGMGALAADAQPVERGDAERERTRERAERRSYTMSGSRSLAMAAVGERPGRPCISVPTSTAGTTLGIVLFNRVDQLSFRRIAPIVLLFSGLSLGV